MSHLVLICVTDGMSRRQTDVHFRMRRCFVGILCSGMFAVLVMDCLLYCLSVFSFCEMVNGFYTFLFRDRYASYLLFNNATLLTLVLRLMFLQTFLVSEVANLSFFSHWINRISKQGTVKAATTIWFWYTNVTLSSHEMLQAVKKLLCHIWCFVRLGVKLTVSLI